MNSDPTVHPRPSIFDALGTLDVVITAVLAALHIPMQRYYPDVATGNTVDAIARRNGETFLNHFGTRKIQAIKQIRLVTGWGLKDAKEAFEAIERAYKVRTWQDAERDAQSAMNRGSYGSAERYLQEASNLRYGF